MAIGDNLLLDFDQEIARTRTTLERVPADRFDWRPHPKSGTLLWLARHVADLPSLGALIVTQDQFEAAPGRRPVEPPPSDTAGIVAVFDSNAGRMRAAIDGASDDDLRKPWSLLNDGTVLFTRPKAALLRTFVMNHMIHHRAQLGVYLRLNDVPVPSLYGPSADEPSPSARA
ncbi:MAG: DinB family protein [Acidobacteria bacterium]|nr:DinB family protein [Acidobacteriota bacterium]